MKTLSTVMFKCSLIIFFGIILTSCANCNYKQMVCPATNVTVNYPKSQKCATKLYEDAVKTYYPYFKGDIDILGKVRLVSLDLGVKQEAQLLSEKLTSEDKLLQSVLKSAAILLAASPCEGTVAYAKAMDDVANQKIRLEQIKADVEKNQNNEAALKETLKDYRQGHTDGKNVGIIRGALDKYYNDNKKYPTNLTELTGENATQAIALLGLAISYTRDTENSYSIRFAGQDGKLNTVDDKLHKGLNGSRVD